MQTSRPGCSPACAGTPEQAQQALRDRGIACENLGLLRNWSEARPVCTPDALHALLGNAALRACRQQRQESDLALCIALGLDVLRAVPGARTQLDNQFTGEKTLLRDEPVLLSLSTRVAARTVSELRASGLLAPLCALPAAGVTGERRAPSAPSVLDVVASCDTPRHLQALLELCDLQAPAIQDAITRTLASIAVDVDRRFDRDNPPLDGSIHPRSEKLLMLFEACADLDAIQNPVAAAPKTLVATLLHVLVRDAAAATDSVDDELPETLLQTMTRLAAWLGEDAIDTVDRTGNSALHYAAAGCAGRLSVFLVEHGADLRLLDAGGNSPETLARLHPARFAAWHRAVETTLANRAARAIARTLTRATTRRPG